MILSFGTKGAFHLSKTSGGPLGLGPVCTGGCQHAAGSGAAHPPAPRRRAVPESCTGTGHAPVSALSVAVLAIQAELSS